MQSTRTVCFLMILVLFVATCGTEGTAFFISDEQEAEIGLGVHDEVIQEYPLTSDQFVQDWVVEIGSNIATYSTDERDGVDYHFYVVDADIVNAFAAPGGFVYITTGLILEADNEAEVASVVGHEIAHVAHRHGVAKLERAMAAGLITSLLFGDGIAADVINFAASFVLSTDYSRDQETQADDSGVVFTYGAGYNPYGMVDFFNQLAESSGASYLPDWLSSHPNPADRADRTEDNIADLGDGISRDSSDLAWELTGGFAEVQSRLSGRVGSGSGDGTNGANGVSDDQ